MADPTANLRALTYWLSSTPTKSLPLVAAQVAGQLWNCRDVLSASAESLKQSNDVHVTVHRFKTYLSTLLQDQRVEARWAAVVLVKATIEAGGLELLSKSNAWVRSLLTILKKPGPPTGRVLTIVTLTRIFTLTWDHANLVREITTPALPTFVATCINNVQNDRCSMSELQAILEAFATLVPRHGTIFRVNEAQIRSLLSRILSSTSSTNISMPYTGAHQAAAGRLLALLHHCSPKQSGGDKFDDALKATITTAHATCDRLFRSVLEGWKSNAGVKPSSAFNVRDDGDAEMEGTDALGLSGWNGVFAGSERLVGLLKLIINQLEVVTSGTVIIRIGLIFDLLSRTFNLRVPSSKYDGAPSNPQVAQDERDSLFSMLPTVHVAAFELAEAVLCRFGLTVVSVTVPLLRQLLWVFAAESSHASLRTATYSVIKVILEMQGPAMTKEDVTEIEPVLKACCQDLLPTTAEIGAASQSAVISADLTHRSSKPSSMKFTIPFEAREAASVLLPVCFAKLPATYIPTRLRTLMERTAVFTQNKDALVACVLNPASGNGRSGVQPSLLPLLARQHPQEPEVEALLRPRMPVIRNKPTTNDEMDDTQDQEMYQAVSTDLASEKLLEDGTQVLRDANPTINGHDQPESDPAVEDLYSASPARPPTNQFNAPSNEAPTSLFQQHPDKRPASEHLDGQAAKRVCETPSVDMQMQEAAPSRPRSKPVTMESAAPTHLTAQDAAGGIQDEQESTQKSMTVAAASTGIAGTSHRTFLGANDDDSDFEMPPLTMDSDTDPEEDSDVGEDNAADRIDV